MFDWNGYQLCWTWQLHYVNNNTHTSGVLQDHANNPKYFINLDSSHHLCKEWLWAQFTTNSSSSCQWLIASSNTQLPRWLLGQSMTQELHACESTHIWRKEGRVKTWEERTQIQMSSLIMRFQKQTHLQKEWAWALKLAMHIEAPQKCNQIQNLFLWVKRRSQWVNKVSKTPCENFKAQTQLDWAIPIVHIYLPSKERR